MNTKSSAEYRGALKSKARDIMRSNPRISLKQLTTEIRKDSELPKAGINTLNSIYIQIRGELFANSG